MLGTTLTACHRQGFSRPEDQYREAKAQLERGELIESLKNASDGAQRYKNTEPVWSSRFRVLAAEVLIWQGKAKDTLSLLEDPLPPMAPEDALVRRNILQATANYRLQEFEKSAAELSEAEQLASSKQPSLLADVVMAKGTLALSKGDYQSAKNAYETALPMARQQRRLFLEASVLGNLGVLSLKEQRCGEAIDWLSDARQAADALHNQMVVSRILGNLGWCYYTLGDFDRALDNYTEAEAVSAKRGAIQDQLTWMNNIGLIHDARQNEAEAATYYRKSLEIARRLEDRLAVSYALNNLAVLAIRTGDMGSAEKYNQEALELKRAIGDKHGELISILNSARIAFGHKQYSDAMRRFREVIYGAGNDESLRWEAESDLAALYAAEGKPVTADLQYKKGLETIDRARASLSKDAHRLSFLNTARRFYNDYIDFLVAHHREREALAVAEHSRARTLAEGLKIPVQLRETAFHPEENARRLNSVVLSYWLKPERSYLWVVTPTRVQLIPLPPQSEIDSAVDEYRKALLGPSQARDSAAGQKLYQMLVAPAEKLITPSYRASTFPSRRHSERSGLTTNRHPERGLQPESRDLHSSPHHEPGSSITSSTPRSDSVSPYLTKSTTRSENVSPHLITSTPRSENVAPHVSAGFKPASLSRVARTRDGRSPTSAPRVIIIADGSLVNLNFETLVVPTPQPHYWIEDATISNASSVALLRASTNRTIVPSGHRAIDNNGPMPSKGTILLIGAPNYSGTEFPELSQARTEVDKVESYFPADERTVIEGKSAVPAAYDAANPSRFTYIHFVAHGTASRLSPLDSSIVLSRQGDAYKLYARDIMQQPLKADLVTISACYGAGNRSYSGEGLVGLSWAFLRAGAHNVIAALWEVNDASTPKLMDDLYRNIKNGEDPATALRHAKLDMLHSNNVYRRPFYWGAFQIYVGS